MNKYLSILNPVLMIACGGLLYMTGQVWLTTTPESRHVVPLNKADSKDLKPINIQPPNYTDAVMGDVLKQNLFRKERKPYVKPIIKKPTPSSLPQVTKRNSIVIPPPKYVLSGILLTRTSKIAFMEGEFSEKTGAQKVEKNQIKRRGYEIGELIGKYRLTDIQKSSVGLTDDRGDTITVKLRKHDSTKTASNNKPRLAKKAKSRNVRVKTPTASAKPENSRPRKKMPPPRPPVRQNVLGGKMTPS